jgi:hypothetical protein
MRPLHLDYCERRAGSSLGTVLFLLGILVGAFALVEYSRLQEELATQQARTAEVRQAGKRPASGAAGNPASVEASAQEFRAAQLAMQRLALRWDDLFTALESTRTAGVALLAIEPDPAKGLVKVTAEARTPDAMLDYVGRLQGVTGLTDVVLASHQVRRGDPQKPMRFILLASWAK